MDFAKILGIVRTAVNAGPAFHQLFNNVLPLFNGAQQTELKSAYQQAIDASDAAEQDFVKASRGH